LDGDKKIIDEGIGIGISGGELWLDEYNEYKCCTADKYADGFCGRNMDLTNRIFIVQSNQISSMIYGLFILSCQQISNQWLSPSNQCTFIKGVQISVCC